MLKQMYWVAGILAAAACMAEPAQAGVPSTSAAAITGKGFRVLVLNFDPILENRSNQRLSEFMGRYDPHALAAAYIADLSNCSHGNAVYSVKEWIDLDEYPLQMNGSRYDDSYADIWQEANRTSDFWSSSRWSNFQYTFDYAHYIDRFRISERVSNNEIDEVFLFFGHDMGMYESRMVGKGAYWCNAPGIDDGASRQYVMMGFTYVREPGCMMENYGHRSEFIMKQIYERWDYTQPLEQMNLWERFSLYDKVKPGHAACGNVHFAPNSTADYDWGNPAPVGTSCDDWLSNFPALSGASLVTNAMYWGSGDMEAHHIWWFKRMPHRSGTNADGKLNNWWKYLTLEVQ